MRTQLLSVIGAAALVLALMFVIGSVGTGESESEITTAAATVPETTVSETTVVTTEETTETETEYYSVHIDIGEGVVVTGDEMVVDTFNGVDALYRAHEYDDESDVYSCAAFVKRYYATVYGVEVGGLFTDLVPTASYGWFEETWEPQPGDIGYQDYCGDGHWFIIKSVNEDGSYTIIEQNWKFEQYGETVCIKDRIVTPGVTPELKAFTWYGW